MWWSHHSSLDCDTLLCPINNTFIPPFTFLILINVFFAALILYEVHKVLTFYFFKEHRDWYLFRIIYFLLISSPNRNYSTERKNIYQNSYIHVKDRMKSLLLIYIIQINKLIYIIQITFVNFFLLIFLINLYFVCLWWITVWYCLFSWFQSIIITTLLLTSPNEKLLVTHLSTTQQTQHYHRSRQVNDSSLLHLNLSLSSFSLFSLSLSFFSVAFQFQHHLLPGCKTCPGSGPFSCNHWFKCFLPPPDNNYR